MIDERFFFIHTFPSSLVFFFSPFFFLHRYVYVVYFHTLITIYIRIFYHHSYMQTFIYLIFQFSSFLKTLLEIRERERAKKMKLECLFKHSMLSISLTLFHCLIFSNLILYKIHYLNLIHEMDEQQRKNFFFILLKLKKIKKKKKKNRHCMIRLCVWVGKRKMAAPKMLKRTYTFFFFLIFYFF